MVGGGAVPSPVVARPASATSTLVCALAVLVIAAVASGCGSNRPSRAEQNRSIAREAGLAPEVADVFALAANGETATYTEAVTTVDTNGKPVQITTVQRPPDRRVDVFNADGTIDATITRDGRSYQCTRANEVWQCGELGPATTSSSGLLAGDIVQHAVDQFRRQVVDYDFAVEHRTIANTPATCLVTTPKAPAASASAPPATLCLSPEGVALLVDSPSGSLTAVSYRASVDANAFDLPAQPVTASSGSN